MTQSPILIIGQSGKTGARVSARLQRQGYSTRGVSRSTTPSFDWTDRSSWPAALAGTRAAYITYQPDLAVPAAAEDMQAFITLARELGLEHLVLLSGRGEEGAERAEDILTNCGLAWNIVRASWFAQNFSESFMLDGILGGELVLPAGDIPEPFIDADDIADVAVAALTRPQLRNRLFEVTGPRSMTFQQCVEEISAATGYPVRYTQVPIDAYIAALEQQGVPAELRALLHSLFTEIFDGRNSHVMHGVEDALQRPATDFSRYVEKTLKTDVWSRQSHPVMA